MTSIASNLSASSSTVGRMIPAQEANGSGGANGPQNAVGGPVPRAACEMGDPTAEAYRESGLTMTSIASNLSASSSTVSRMIRAREANGSGGAHEPEDGAGVPVPHARRAKWET
jgi:hypothetical protein